MSKHWTFRNERARCSHVITHTQVALTAEAASGTLCPVCPGTQPIVSSGTSRQAQASSGPSVATLWAVLSGGTDHSAGRNTRAAEQTSRPHRPCASQIDRESERRQASLPDADRMTEEMGSGQARLQAGGGLNELH